MNFISSRPKNTISFDQIRIIYTEISKNSNEKIDKTLIQSRIGNKEANNFINTPNYMKSENAKLKYLINLY